METQESPRLLIVENVFGEWVVDQDSAYILDEASEGHSTLTLSIVHVEPLSRG